MTKIVRGVGVISVGKVAAVVYACIGLLVGSLVAMISMFGGFASLLSHDRDIGAVGLLFFGVGAIFFFPILYGCIGALLGMFVAAVYNGAAKIMGGIELEID